MSIKSKYNYLIRQLIEDPKYVINPDGRIYNLKGKELGYTQKSELDLRQKQYRYIKYRSKHIKIHRIIYAKFIGELKQRYVIHHKDGNGLNNDVSNLDQITQQYNMHFKLYPYMQDDSVQTQSSEGEQSDEIPF